MKITITKWMWITGVLAGLPLLAGAVLFAVSEFKLRDFSTPPPFETAIPNDPARIENGRHIARTRGCFGCHGQQLEGRVFADQWYWVDVAVAPNLARFARDHDAQVLEAAIRHGVGHDGKALWSMPSYNFTYLSDDEIADLIAYLRSAPVVSKDLPEPSLGLPVRWQLATGQDDHMAAWVQSLPSKTVKPEEGHAMANGEQLAMTTCNECHGLDLRGAWAEKDFSTPDLAIVAAYSWNDFVNLMKNGEASGGRTDMGLMTMVARDRFASFTDQELEDLYLFLQSLPKRPIPRNVFWRSQH